MAGAARPAPHARARAADRRSAAPARIRGAAGRTSGSSTRRTTGATTSCSATSSGATTRSGCTCTSGSRAPTARSRCTTRSATSCPSCSRSRRARRSSRTSTPACTPRARRSSRACSRAAASPTPYGSWQGWEDYVAFLYRTGSITEHTQIWWSVRPHLAYPTIEIRICDGQPDLAEAQSLAALCYALAARCARAYDEGEPLPRPAAPPARGEHVAGDPLRPVRRAARLRARRGGAGARRRLEQLLEWVARSPTRSARPLSPTSRSGTPPSARSQRLEEGATPERDLRRAGADGRADGG